MRLWKYVFLLAFCTCLRAQYFSRPIQPISPISYKECSDYMDKWDTLKADADEAHEKCMNADSVYFSATYVEVVAKANTKCAVRSCQRIHDQDAAITLEYPASREIGAACNEEVKGHLERVQQEQEEERKREQERDFQDHEPADPNPIATLFNKEAAAARASRPVLSPSSSKALDSAIADNEDRRDARSAPGQSLLAKVDPNNSAFKSMVGDAIRAALQNSGETGSYIVKGFDKASKVQENINFFSNLLKTTSGTATDSEKLDVAARTGSAIFDLAVSSPVSSAIAGQAGGAIFAFDQQALALFERSFVGGDSTAGNDVAKLGFNLGVAMMPSWAAHLFLVAANPQITWEAFVENSVVPHTPLWARGAITQ